ncbi:hypothetical protein [Spirosoma gilvum]
MDTNTETITFEESIALQFDLLRGTHLILKEYGRDTDDDWPKCMENVLTHRKQHFEAGEITQEQYEYIVNFWLDNYPETTRPILQY